MAPKRSLGVASMGGAKIIVLYRERKVNISSTETVESLDSRRPSWTDCCLYFLAHSGLGNPAVGANAFRRKNQNDSPE